ncbi:hypothetical protein [Streptomyces sp. PU-14G]|uniref:hypothetical protein n=1 Tax=Streptomyces sp. PU-14G TaxID=2800808 RepID=UPI0034DF5374
MTVLTPAASAEPAAPKPVTCRDAQGRPYLKGESKFSGTLPSLKDTAAGAKPVFRSRVDWSDGTVTTGTFTDFKTSLTQDGGLEFTIKGFNDADSTTRFAGYSVSAVGRSARLGMDPAEEVQKSQKGKIAYMP